MPFGKDGTLASNALSDTTQYRTSDKADAPESSWWRAALYQEVAFEEVHVSGPSGPNC